MKRALRVIVPVLLVIAVIFSIGWYFVKYDPDMTRDILLSQARIMEDQGNHTLATWFYKLAYQQSGNDEIIALELAEQYRSMGNYTKAEYTLSNAIADGGSIELYIALCNTYVEQDKLLDAVTMLDNVAEPQIKAQLDALRPQMPALNREPGFYSEYLSLVLTVPEGSIYASVTGEYPSTATIPYHAPIALTSGKTTLQCLAVGENGLVSPLLVANFTITGIVEPVTIDDPAMDSQIRQLLQVDDSHTLYTNELWTITSLTVPSRAESLSDLVKLPYLQSLTIHAGSFDSLSVLSVLTSLETLNLSETAVSEDDLRVIGSLPKLKELNMTKCSLSGISPLVSATGLTHLSLGSNTIRDLSALQGMTELTHLNLSHNAVTGLDALSGLAKLEQLDLSYNSITDVAPLTSCTALTSLNLSGNKLTALNGIGQLSNLQTLSVAFNELVDVSSLCANTGLTELDISNNKITDITMLNTLSKLMSLNFSYNQVDKLPAFSKDANLISIKGSQNKLTSLDELAGLEMLNYVLMDFNAELENVDALAQCYTLVEVSVFGTKVREVAALTDMGIIVKYSPI